MKGLTQTQTHVFVCRHACIVWIQTQLTHAGTVKNTLRFTDTHSYISISTVPSRSPCAELLIASLILICQIPLGSYHWRVSLRVKNTMLSSLVPSLAFPTPWFKNSSGFSRPLCFGKESAMLSLSVENALSQWAVVHRPKWLGLIAKPRNIEGLNASTSWCRRWDVNSGDWSQMVEEIH